MDDIELSDGMMAIINSLNEKAVQSANVAATMKRQADKDRLVLEGYLEQLGEKFKINIKDFDVMLRERVLRQRAVTPTLPTSSE